MAKIKTEMLAGGIRALVEGQGTPVILVPGWPETAEAYGEVIPLLAAHHSVICIDPPGLGDSDPSTEGYDTGTVSMLLARAIQQRITEPYHLVGHDVGAWIAYPWASQLPESVRSLALLDSALPGLTASRTYPLPPELNVKLWQFSFNMLPDLPETLTAGREREFIGWLVKNKAVHPQRVVSIDRYVESYARPGAMAKGFEYYRATPKSAAQNQEFAKQRLSMPVLALGGRSGVGDSLRSAMESLANHVEGDVIEDCGHYVMEEQPRDVANELLAFFKRAELRR